MAYLSDEEKARDVARSLSAMRTSPAPSTAVTQPTNRGPQASGMARTGQVLAPSRANEPYRTNQAGADGVAGISKAVSEFEAPIAGSLWDTSKAYGARSRENFSKGNYGEALVNGFVAGSNAFGASVALPGDIGAAALGGIGRSVGRGLSLNPDQPPILGTPEQLARQNPSRPAGQPAGAPTGNPALSGIAAATGKPAGERKVLSPAEYMKSKGRMGKNGVFENGAIDEGYFAQGGDRGLPAPLDPYGYASRLGLKPDDQRVREMTLARMEEDRRANETYLQNRYNANRVSEEAYLADKNGYGSAGASAAIAQALASQGQGPGIAERSAAEAIDSRSKANAALATSPEAQLAAAMSQIAGSDPKKYLELRAEMDASTKPVSQQTVTKNPTTGEEVRTESSMPAFFANRQGKNAPKAEPPAALAKIPKAMEQFDLLVSDPGFQNASEMDKLAAINGFLKEHGLKESILNQFFLQHLQPKAK